MKVVKKENLGDLVYEQISQCLLTGEMRPNDKLTIRGLTEKLQVSSTPVRDALMRLTQEKVLKQRSPKDVRVPVMSAETYLEILAIRLRLEGLAAATAATKADPKQTRALRRILARNDQAISKGNWATAIECNQAFHLGLCEISQMPTLHGILRGLWLRMGPIIAGYYETGPKSLNNYHYDIVAAIETKDAVSAEQAMQADLNAAHEAILFQIETFSTMR